MEVNIDRYTRARWSLAEIAAIIHNPHFPVSFRVLQSLTTGQLARIQTSPAEKGTRRGYDFVSLVKFLLAVRLMKVHGLPSRMLQHFFDSIDKGSFGRDEVLESGKRFPKILLPEMLDGYFIALVNDPPNDGVFQFYPTEENSCSASESSPWQGTRFRNGCRLAWAIQRGKLWAESTHGKPARNLRPILLGTTPAKP